jgi:preprotein translocase subunit SecA
MDYLREGIHLRGFAQIDPLVAYKNEGFEMFSGLVNIIWEEFARYIFNVEVEVEGRNGGGDGAQPQQERQWAQASSSSSTGRLRYTGGRAPAGATAIAEAAAAPADGDVAAEAPKPVETRVLDEHERIGRNDPCWCGSGKKYKKCHGAQA